MAETDEGICAGSAVEFTSVESSSQPLGDKCVDSVYPNTVGFVVCETAEADRLPTVVEGEVLKSMNARRKSDERKNPLEKPLYRRFFWSSAKTAVDVGGVLAKMGMRKSHHQVLRTITGISANMRYPTLPGLVSAYKDTISGVSCRIYVPTSIPGASPTKRPVIIYIHGGGWVILSARAYHPFTQNLCRDSGAIVISVDYRLAPEHPYPAQIEDCLAVTRAVLNAANEEPSRTSGRELSGLIDIENVMVAGDSAGGNLAGVVALELIRQGDKRLKGVALICPVTQAITFLHESYIERAGRYHKEGLGWCIAQYAGVAPTRKVTSHFNKDCHIPEDERQRWIRYVMPNGSQEKIPNVEGKPSSKTGSRKNKNAFAFPDEVTKLVLEVRAWPSLAEDEHLKELPPTFLQSCSHDMLMSENISFVERLRNSGAKHVIHSHVEGAEHCEGINSLLMRFNSKSGSQCYSDLMQFINNVLTHQF